MSATRDDWLQLSVPPPVAEGAAEQPTVAGPSWQGLLSPPELPDEIGRLGGFRVLRMLGAGGMGMVFLAEDPQLRRRVALKVLRPEILSDAPARLRFLNEARAIAAVASDYIIPIHQIAEDRGVLFLALPLLTGQALDRWLCQGGKPNWPQVFRLGRELLQGLATAHAVGLVHRDIKPSNLWLEAPHGRLKILDFGLVQSFVSSHSDRAGQIAGTPGFVSPEQAQGRAVDHRSDLFSAGVVLYLLCSGKLPYSGVDLLSFAVQLETQAVPPLAAARADIPPRLAAFVHRLMALNPADRPNSAGDALAELDSIQGELAADMPHDWSSRAQIPLGDGVNLPAAAGSVASSSPTQPSGRPRSWTLALGILALLAAAVSGFFLSRKIEFGGGLPAATVQTSSRFRYREVGRVIHPAITEASALQRSLRQPALYWTVNDAHGPPNLYALNDTGQVRGIFQIDSVVNEDWEALTADAAGHLYIGDLGNNNLRYSVRHVYQIREPDLAPGHAADAPPQTVPVLRRFSYSYPEERKFDAESLIYWHGALYTFDKNRTGLPPQLYRLSLEHPGQTVPMERVGRLRTSLIAVTDACLSPDGRRVALLGQGQVAVYELPADGDFLAILRLEPRLIPLDLLKAEGCTWDGSELVINSEYRRIVRLSLE